MRADHSENGHGERDIGRGGNGPAEQSAIPGAEVEQHENDCGNDHSADGRGHRQCGACRIAQITGNELAFEFESDDEEEDGQQPVGGPRRQSQIEMQGRRPDASAHQCVVGGGPR